MIDLLKKKYLQVEAEQHTVMQRAAGPAVGKGTPAPPWL